MNLSPLILLSGSAACFLTGVNTRADEVHHTEQPTPPSEQVEVKPDKSTEGSAKEPGFFSKSLDELDHEKDSIPSEEAPAESVTDPIVQPGPESRVVEAKPVEDGKASSGFALKLNQIGETQGWVIKLVYAETHSEDIWISDVVVYWTTSDGVGVIIPLREVSESIWATKLDGEIKEGKHKLQASLTLRGHDGSAQRVIERDYLLDVPEFILTTGNQRTLIPRPPESKPAKETAGGSSGKGRGSWSWNIVLFLSALMLGVGLRHPSSTLRGIRNFVLSAISGKLLRRRRVFAKDAEVAELNIHNRMDSPTGRKDSNNVVDVAPLNPEPEAETVDLSDAAF